MPPRDTVPTMAIVCDDPAVELEHLIATLVD
jgi:hypothetical protein